MSITSCISVKTETDIEKNPLPRSDEVELPGRRRHGHLAAFAAPDNRGFAAANDGNITIRFAEDRLLWSALAWIAAANAARRDQRLERIGCPRKRAPRRRRARLEISRIDIAVRRRVQRREVTRVDRTRAAQRMARARRDLERLGVEVRVNTMVTDITEQGVHVGDAFIPTQSVFWAAGNAASWWWSKLSSAGSYLRPMSITHTWGSA